MEGSHGGSSSPAPFLIKTYEMLDDPSTNSIVSWSASGGSFVVWNHLDFARDLLPTYFKHNNFSSFIRQLNTYGFKKIDPERWEFANDEFIRGQKHLLINIHRRKPIHSHSIPPLGSNASMPLSESERQEIKEEIERLKHEKSTLITELQKHTQNQQGMDLLMQDLEERLQGMVLRQRNLVSFLDQIIQRPGFFSSLIQPLGSNASMPLSESERQEIKEEIERLKHEKSTLITELQKHTQNQQGMDLLMQDLEERLQGMVLRQRNLVSFLDQIIQRPGFFSSLIQPSDLHAKKRRLPEHDYFLENSSLQDEKNLSFLLDIEPFEKMESSLNSLETFFHEVGQASGEEDALFEDRLPCLNSSVFPTIMCASSGETDIDRPSPTHHSAPSSSCPEDISLYPELPDSPAQAQSTISPVVDCPSLRTGTKSLVSDIDMNSEPTAHLRDQELATPATMVAAGVNDTFWEQFFTENPSYSDTQSEKSDLDNGRRAEEAVTEQGSAWWNRKSVDHLTERMGNLTSTERTS